MYRVSIVYVSCIYRVCIVTTSGIMAAKVVKIIDICKFFITFFCECQKKVVPLRTQRMPMGTLKYNIDIWAQSVAPIAILLTFNLYHYEKVCFIKF
jgi:hypothetical protein